MLYAVFDLDGVLIDSRHVILCAYRDAGVEPPEDILSREGDDWIPGDREFAIMTRSRKNIAYMRRIRDDPLTTLPPYALACQLATLGVHISVFSGAPYGTLEILRPRMPYWPFKMFSDGVKTPTKMSLIRTLPNAELGVYIDDQERFIDLPSNWTFVRYVGQDLETLRREVYDEALCRSGLSACG